MKISALLIVLSCLSGCGIADHFNQSNKVDQDEKDYRGCLAANSTKPDTCAPLKEIWEADKTDYVTGNY